MPVIHGTTGGRNAVGEGPARPSSARPKPRPRVPADVARERSPGVLTAGDPHRAPCTNGGRPAQGIAEGNGARPSRPQGNGSGRADGGPWRGLAPGASRRQARCYRSPSFTEETWTT